MMMKKNKNNNRIKSQATIEYMAMLGLSLLIFTGILYITSSSITKATINANIDSAFKAVQQIREGADFVALSPHPGKITQLVRIPQSIEEIEINKTIVRLRISSADSYTDVYAIAKGNTTSYMRDICHKNSVCDGGKYKFIFESLSEELPRDVRVTTDPSCTDCGLGEFCVDGVCCKSGCSDVCETCNYPGEEETCRSYDAGTDPEDECNSISAGCLNTCSRGNQNSSCNGASACEKSITENCASNNYCSSDACIPGYPTPCRTCDGSGNEVDTPDTNWGDNLYDCIGVNKRCVSGVCQVM